MLNWIELDNMKRDHDSFLTFNSKKNTVVSILLYLKDFIVEVILKGFAVLRVLFLLLELLVSFGAGAASCTLALLLRLVPLLLLVTVHLSGHP